MDFQSTPFSNSRWISLSHLAKLIISGIYGFSPTSSFLHSSIESRLIVRWHCESLGLTMCPPHSFCRVLLVPVPSSLSSHLHLVPYFNSICFDLFVFASVFAFVVICDLRFLEFPILSVFCLFLSFCQFRPFLFLSMSTVLHSLGWVKVMCLGFLWFYPRFFFIFIFEQTFFMLYLPRYTEKPSSDSMRSHVLVSIFYASHL